MSFAQPGDFLIHKGSSYFRDGDRLKVIAVTVNQRCCFAVIQEPGHSHPHQINFPLDPERWTVETLVDRKLAKIAALHSKHSISFPYEGRTANVEFCLHDEQDWPCATQQILDGLE